MTNFDDIYIDRYLLNQLTISEQTDFEQTMEADTILKKRVQEHKQLIKATQLTGLMETKAQIRAVTKSWARYVPDLAVSVQEKMQHTKQSIMATAEEIVALVNQFFRPYAVSFRNTLSDNPTLEENAFNFYNKKDYEQALALLKQLPDTNKEAQLMIGNALLIMQQQEAALGHFKQLIEEKPIGYVSEAHWYAGLALLQLNRKDEAKEHFQKISADEYAGKKIKKKAHEILEQLAGLS